MLTSRHKYLFILVAISLLIKLFCIGSNDLLVEEAYYWNYSAHLDFSYFDHPPMVALLIRLSTYLFGINEFGVRFPSIVCWVITALFSFKLTELIKPHAGFYAVLLLAILPFFFIHSLVITPDVPLIVCWSAALYYLYKAVVLDHNTAWYLAGVWLGLGMLSKYTIVLLGPATLLYLIFVPDARKWFRRKEPYACLLITVALFTPVIYWNAMHEWASFAFQSTRRLQSTFSFSFHELLGLFVAFLTPLGVLGFCSLFRRNTLENNKMGLKTAYFLRMFILVPLLVFSLFSFSHEIKFNWIGPGLLAIIPWLAVLIETAKPALYRGWLITAVVLLFFYSAMIGCIISGKPETLNRQLFSKYIAWNDLTRQVFSATSKMETPPIIVPMDLYNIASELAFYQAKFAAQQKLTTSYTIIGRDLFGLDSLMYRYWSKNEATPGAILLLIAENPALFKIHEVRSRVIDKSVVKALWAHSQGYGGKIRKYYYQVVQMTRPSS